MILVRIKAKNIILYWSSNQTLHCWYHFSRPSLKVTCQVVNATQCYNIAPMLWEPLLYINVQGSTNLPYNFRGKGPVSSCRRKSNGKQSEKWWQSLCWMFWGVGLVYVGLLPRITRRAGHHQILFFAKSSFFFHVTRVVTHFHVPCGHHPRPGISCEGSLCLVQSSSTHSI